jgi:hypothetical protein
MGALKKIRNFRDWCPQPPNHMPTSRKIYANSFVIVLATTLICGISLSFLYLQATSSAVIQPPIIPSQPSNSTQTPSPTPSPTLTPTPTSYQPKEFHPSIPRLTPTPTLMPGLPSPPPAYLSLSMNPLTVQINEQVSGNITTNIHDFNATVTYINTQSGETKQMIVPCINHSGQFSVILTQTGSYSFIAEFENKDSNTVQISVS